MAGLAATLFYVVVEVRVDLPFSGRWAAGILCCPVYNGRHLLLMVVTIIHYS